MWLLLVALLLSACSAVENRPVASSGAESTLVVTAIDPSPGNQPGPPPRATPAAADTQVRVAEDDSLSTAMAAAQLRPSPEGDSVTEIGGAIMPAPYWVHEY